MNRTEISIAVIFSGAVSIAACGGSDTSREHSDGGSGTGGDAGNGGAENGGAHATGGNTGNGGAANGGSTGGSNGTAGKAENDGGATGGTAGSSDGGDPEGGDGASGQDGSAPVLPVGDVPGRWTLAFDDEFDGLRLDSDKWTPMDGGGWGAATCKTENVSVSSGNLALTLASSSSGGCVCTGSSCAPAFGGYFSAGSRSYDLPVGGYAEARINFPGSGTKIYNWPAWWTSGPSWPAGGENDIAEGCGTLTASYHSPSGAHNYGTVAGTWASGFHVYGMHRMPRSVDVYYDGKKVLSYPTDDNGAPQSLLLDLTEGCGGTPLYGDGSKVLVDYVRAWQ